MRLTAVLRTGDERDESPASERNEAFDRRRSLRHPLRLCACTSAPWPGDSPVLILDISQGGLLIEADPSTVSVYDRIEIMLPDKGPVQLAERIAQTVHPFGASRPHLPRVVAGHSRTRSFAVCIAH